MGGKQNEVRERLQEFDRCWTAGDYYSAFQKLAALHSASPKLSAAQRQQFRDVVARIQLNDQIAKAIQKGVKDDISKTLRILSIGCKFVDDEILLVMTLREQLDFVRHFVQAFFGDIELDKDDMDEVDTAIRRVRKSHEIDELFISAGKLMRKNAKLQAAADIEQ